MLKLSRKTLLALEAVIDIAFNARPEPVQAKEITARQGVPQRYLEQVMQQLVRAGILKGVRGPRGGYRLAKERRRISVGDIVRVAESIEDENGEDTTPRSELGIRIVDAVHPVLAGRSDGAAGRHHHRGFLPARPRCRRRLRRSKRPRISRSRRTNMERQESPAAAASTIPSPRPSATRRWCGWRACRKKPASKPTSC